MSINKVFLPELKELKEFLHLHGEERFYQRFIKNREAFIGPSNSIKFIDEFIEKSEFFKN
jgi:hypothetical protein